MLEIVVERCGIFKCRETREIGIVGKIESGVWGFYWWGKGKNSMVSVGFNSVVFHFQMHRLT